MSGIQGFCVRWIDAEGNNKTKDYSDLATARKAVKWLEENGGQEVDVAIVMREKPVEKIDTPPIEHHVYKD